MRPVSVLGWGRSGRGEVALAFAFGVGETSCVTKVTTVRKGGADSPRKRN